MICHLTIELQHGSNYDYAVPELGSAPLLLDRLPPLGRLSAADTVSERLERLSERAADRSSDGRSSVGGSFRSRLESRSLSQQDVLVDLRRRLETTNVIEFPRHRLRMISKLAEGAFGTVYVAEADGIPEYGGNIAVDKKLVAVKFLSHDASLKERAEFERDVRILAALSSPQLARVLGACRTLRWPVLEYLELGDLCAFLRSQRSITCTGVAAYGRANCSWNAVFGIPKLCTQRSGSKAKGYQVKIADFGTDNDTYVRLLPKWMAECLYRSDGPHGSLSC
ncbi:Discoidin domain-containing receptor 2 [Eumeta japonica]|uniref:Discoidin domain-containing receptor 2 n=1 Tax=Eumeta variegata TaxID=151549 RepID=A0A4C2A7Q7_EUMVA|nr:Discoidin domain-containing receptor 2 [Eumeta japonica]